MENFESRVTYHCCGRMDERAGLKGNEAVRFAKNAIRNGKKAEDCRSSSEKKYLTEKSHGDVLAIAYNGFCFIVDKTTECAITMYQLPEWFGKQKVYDGKTKVKNAKKYMRMNSMCYADAMVF